MVSSQVEKPALRDQILPETFAEVLTEMATIERDNPNETKVDHVGGYSSVNYGSGGEIAYRYQFLAEIHQLVTSLHFDYEDVKKLTDHERSFLELSCERINDVRHYIGHTAGIRDLVKKRLLETCGALLGIHDQSSTFQSETYLLEECSSAEQ